MGLLDATTVYGGYRLVTVDGRELASDAGLTIQGVEDGGVVTVAAGVADPSPRVYDDVVEAMADVVERDLKPWSPETGRRTALSAAGLLMGLGALALLIQHESTVAVAAAALVALALVVGAIVLSRGQDEPDAAVAVAWMGAGYAAVAGLMYAVTGVTARLLRLSRGGRGRSRAGRRAGRPDRAGRGAHPGHPADRRRRDLRRGRPGHRAARPRPRGAC